jgi:hypothetical protein
MDQHLDAERLAAFMEGSLSRRERLAVEAHASECAECLQLLAAMTRTEPIPADQAWRPFVPLRWAVPLVAAATAIALWVNVERGVRAPQAPLEERPASEVARSEPATPPAAAPATRPPAPPPTVLQQAPDEKRQRQTARGGTLDEQRKKAREQANSPTAGDRIAAAAPPAAAGQAVDTLARRAESAGARFAATALEIVSPDPLRRWRIAGLAVQGSTDGGKTWTTQLASSEGELLTGSAPAPNIAWLAGRAGLVLLTTDGASWQRVAFPEAVDLIAIRARNERDAEVTAAGGRTFRTQDGGKTWSLQEFAP